MEYRINIKNRGSVFFVPYKVVNEKIKLASGDFLKVLLCILSCDEDTIVSENIARQCGLENSKVEDAVEFWIQEKIIHIDTATLNVEYIEAKTTDTNELKSVISSENPAKNTLATKAHIRYTPRDIEKKVSCDNELQFMMDNIQTVLKRPINHTEQSALINLYEYYGFSVGIILMLYEYCEQIGKTNIGYVEAIAKSWFENNIVTHESVEKEIIRLIDNNTVENKIHYAFGLENSLTQKQRDFINNWTSLGFNIEMIMLAYEKCVDQTNKLSFPYINKILTNWAENGYYTKQDVSKNDEKNKKTKEQKDSPSYNLDDFYQLALNSTPDFKGE